MNDLLSSMIHESLIVIKDACSSLRDKNEYDYKDVYRAALLIEHEAQQLKTAIREQMGDDLFSQAEVKENDSSFLNQIARVTEELMPTGNVDIKHVAAKLSITPRVLRNRLSKMTDFSPSNYLLYLRIECSKRYLARYPDVTIIDTAYRCGFSDNAYFTKVFHRFTGLTPLQYIKQTRFTPPQFVIILYHSNVVSGGHISEGRFF